MPFVGYILSFIFSVYIGYVIGFAAIAISLLNLINSDSHTRIPKYLIFYFLFVIYSLIINYANDLIINQVHFWGTNKIIYSFFILFIIENTIFNDSYILKLYRLLKFTVIFAVIVGTVQLLFFKTFFINPNMIATNQDVSSYLLADLGRVPNVETYAGGLMFFLLTFVSILIFRFNNKENTFGNIRKYWIFIYIALVGYLIFISQHRWLMVAYLIVLFQFSVYSKSFLVGSVRNVIIISILIGISYFILTNIGYDIDYVIEKRVLQSDRALEQNTGYSRIMAYFYFADFFPQNPVFGTGPTLNYEIKSVVSTQVHVGWLSLFLYYGLIGGLLFLSSVYLLGKEIFILAKKTRQYIVPFVFIAFIWMNFMQVVIHFLEWGFLISLIIFGHQRQKYSNTVTTTEY